MTAPFRILLIGAGNTGARVLGQLRKRRGIEVIVADPRPEPAAVASGLIEKVDIQEALTPLTLESILTRSKPDLILLAMSPEDAGLGAAAGVEVLLAEMQKEIAALSDVPVIEVVRGHM